jgi:hypothetical protein
VDLTRCFSTRSQNPHPLPPNNGGRRVGAPDLISFALNIFAGAFGGAAFFPELVPIPEAVHHFVRQRESELVREHEDLAAVVGFVGKHVAQHFRAGGPRLGPAVAEKFLDLALAAESFSEHVGAAGGAFGESRAGLLWCAVRAIELGGNFQMRSGEPDPLAADIVHVGEDGGDVAHVAERFYCGLRSPCGRVQMFDYKLVHSFVRGKDLEGGLGKIRLNLWLVKFRFTGGHRWTLAPMIIASTYSWRIGQELHRNRQITEAPAVYRQ